jgi:DNA-binding transcriptional ArsR family regulator
MRVLDNGAAEGYHYHMRLNITAEPPLTAVCGDLCNVPCFKEDVVTRLRSTMPPDERLEEAGVLFAALADRTRLKVLHALSSCEELCVCDVAHVLNMSVSAASHHLRKLRDLKILKYRNDGKMVYYSLRDRFAAELVQQALRQAQS